MKAEDRVLKFIQDARDSDDLEKLSWVIRQVHRENYKRTGSLTCFVNCIYAALKDVNLNKQFYVIESNRRAALIQMQAEFSEQLLVLA